MYRSQHQHSQNTQWQDKKDLKYWECYHKLSCSTHLKSQWTTFLVSPIGAPPCSQLEQYTQYIIQCMGDKLLQDRFPLLNKFQHVEELTSDEEQGLRYAVGYASEKISRKVNIIIKLICSPSFLIWQLLMMRHIVAIAWSEHTKWTGVAWHS